MKRLTSTLAKIIALVVGGVFLSSISVFAFQNLSTTGSGTTTGGGGSGSTPSLSQVTAVGATTNDQVFLLGGVTSTNATATRFIVNGMGSAAAPSVVFAGGGGNDGFYLQSVDQVGIAAGGALKIGIDAADVAFTVTTRASGDLTVDLGTLGTRWRTVFAGNVSSTNATTTQMALGFGSLAQPALKWVGSGGNFGAYMNGPTQLVLTAADTQRILIDSGDVTFANGTAVRPLTSGSLSLGVASAMWSTIWGGTVTTTNDISTFSTTTRASISSLSATGTLMINDLSSLPGCIGLKDTDGTGVTYITGNNGVLSASTTNCR